MELLELLTILQLIDFSSLIDSIDMAATVKSAAVYVNIGMRVEIHPPTELEILDIYSSEFFVRLNFLFIVSTFLTIVIHI